RRRLLDLRRGLRARRGGPLCTARAQRGLRSDARLHGARPRPAQSAPGHSGVRPQHLDARLPPRSRLPGPPWPPWATLPPGASRRATAWPARSVAWPASAFRNIFRANRMSEREPAPTIQLRGVSKWYGTVAALSDLSMSARSGVVGLLGPSGAGKTSLLRILV